MSRNNNRNRNAGRRRNPQTQSRSKLRLKAGVDVTKVEEGLFKDFAELACTNEGGIEDSQLLMLTGDTDDKGNTYYQRMQELKKESTTVETLIAAEEAKYKLTLFSPPGAANLLF